MLEKALEYAAMGYRVFPLHTAKDGLCTCGKEDCESPAKHPHIKRWQHEATTDEQKIREWWGKWPNANIGLATGAGLLVLDCDPRHHGPDSLERLQMLHGPLTAGPVCQTGRGDGGKHFYFKDPGGAVKTGSAFLGGEFPGLDSRGEGGYVVAPPSVHATGGVYQWEVGSELGEVELPDVPAWMCSVRTTKRGSRASASSGGPIPEGQRNDTLFKIGASMRAKGCTRAAIEAALQTENTSRCKPPLPAAEVSSIVDSASSYEPGQIGQVSGGIGADTIEAPPYRMTREGIFMVKLTRDAAIETELCNFPCRILRDIRRSNGVEDALFHEVEATVNHGTRRLQLGAIEFAAMSWPQRVLGTNAIVAPGMGTKDQVRVAIQRLSTVAGPVPEAKDFCHTGWVQVDGANHFLSSMAAAQAGLECHLQGALEMIALPLPLAEDELRRAAEEYLSLWDLAPDAVSVALFVAPFRAILGSCRFSLFLVGPTGIFKSALAAIAQQFFAPAARGDRLPGSWTSTENMLEEQAFLAKDVVIVVDDFVPSGTLREVSAMNRRAERLLRSAANGSGRGRMNSDTSLKQAHPPRGLILSTGEDLPAGHSLRARCIVMELQRGDTSKERLTAAQEVADSGLLAGLMAAVVDWVAPRLEELRGKRVAMLRLMRERLSNAGHARVPDAIADLALGLSLFVEFARHHKLMPEEQLEDLMKRGMSALVQLAEQQAAQLRDADPVDRFQALLSNAIAGRRCHLCSETGDQPQHSKSLGWNEFGGQGPMVGWISTDAVYLLPEVALRACRDVAQGGEGWTLSLRALRKQLNQRGLLLETEKAGSRGTYTVRKSIGGGRHAVLALRRDWLLPAEGDQDDQDDQEDDVDSAA